MSKAESPNSPGAVPSGVRFRLSRLNQILLLVLIVQGVLIAYLFWPRGSAAAGGPLLGELAAADVAAIEIADNNDALLRLTRTDDGWVLAEAGDYPANGEKIDEILGKVLAISTDRMVTQTPSSHSRLQVAEDEYNRRLTLTTPAGDKTIYLGSSAGAGASHARAAGQDATYLTGELAAWELTTQPSSWINTQYFSVPADDIVALSLDNENGELSFVRDEADGWTLADLGEGEIVDSNSINALVNRLATVNLSAPLGTEMETGYGFDQPTATVVLTVDNEGDTTSHTLTVGAKQESDNSYVFKSSGSQFYVTVPAFLGDEVAATQRSDYLTAPEEQRLQTGDEESALPEKEDAQPATAEPPAQQIDPPQSPLPTPAPEAE